MRILVLDDELVHCTSAEALRDEHEVVIHTDFFRAMELWTDSNVLPFDAVLTDLLIEGNPLGILLAARAKQEEVPKIAVVSAGNRHQHDFMYALHYFFYKKSGMECLGIPLFLGPDCPTLGDEKAKDWREVLNQL